MTRHMGREVEKEIKDMEYWQDIKERIAWAKSHSGRSLLLDDNKCIMAVWIVNWTSVSELDGISLIDTIQDEIEE